MAPRPSVKAVLICDYVIHEALTNKKSLIGIFEQIHLPKFPCGYPRIAVYVNMTDAHGKYVLELRLIGEDGQQVGTGKTPEVTIDSPLKTFEVALQVQNLMFRKPGVYEFQVFANGDLAATKSFHVRQAGQK